MPCLMVGGHGLLAACGIKLATAGYGVFGIDYEGHGKSMGARCYIQKFENLVADCDRFFKSICGKKKIFLEFSVIFLKITAETLQKFIAYLPPQLLSEQSKIFTSIYTSLRVYNVTFDSLYIL